MPLPIRPPAAKAYTRTNWIWIPTIASAALAPTVAEATGASALDITLMGFDGTMPDPQLDGPLVDQQRRFGDSVVYQFAGPVKYTGGTVVLQMNPQAAAASDPVKAWEKFTVGATGFFARRLNVSLEVNVTAGQFLDVFPAEIGGRLPGMQGSGPEAEGAFSFSWAVTAPPAFKIAVLA